MVTPDDYFVINIDGVHGRVISNNRHVNGSFAVLHAGVGDDAEHNGGQEFHMHDPNGLTDISFEQPVSNMNHLTVKVSDRLGNAPHVGRLHLWFRVYADCI